MRNRFASAALAALLGLALTTQQTRAQSLKPSRSEQVRLGKGAADEIRKKEKVLPQSDERVRMLRKVGERLLAQIPEKERRDMPWQFSFDVVDAKQINAFALPGGPVFFYTGLYRRLKTEDEIAGVVAHEITHTRKEHWARDYAKQQGQSLLLLLGGALLGANGSIMNMASLGGDLLMNLPRSRSFEYEADSSGYELLVKGGYNPQGMVDVFKTLQEAGGSGAPEYLSTHPDAKNRIKRLTDRIAADNKRYPPQKPLRLNMIERPRIRGF